MWSKFPLFQVLHTECFDGHSYAIMCYRTGARSNSPIWGGINWSWYLKTGHQCRLLTLASTCALSRRKIRQLGGIFVICGGKCLTCPCIRSLLLPSIFPPDICWSTPNLLCSLRRLSRALQSPCIHVCLQRYRVACLCSLRFSPCKRFLLQSTTGPECM